MDEYQHALLSANLTFDEWKSNGIGFQCKESSENQFIMLCKDNWEKVGEQLDYHKIEAEDSATTLTGLMLLIGFQLLLILGLVVYLIFKMQPPMQNGMFFSPIDLEDKREKDVMKSPIISPKFRHTKIYHSKLDLDI